MKKILTCIIRGLAYRNVWIGRIFFQEPTCLPKPDRKREFLMKAYSAGSLSTILFSAGLSNRWAYVRLFAMLTCLSLIIYIPAAKPQSRPNILVIVLDDARYDSFSPDGGPDFFNTPFINRIATEGVNFKNYFVTTAVCAPSRASIYTGLYAHHHGCRSDADSPNPGLAYVSSILQNNGYYTGFIGKWLYDDVLPDTPVGFNFWVVTDHFGHVNPVLKFNDGTSYKYSGFDAEAFTHEAMDFWKNKVPAGKPWVLFMCHRVPHTPYQQPAGDKNIYESDTMPFPDNFDYYQKYFPSYLYPDNEYPGDSATLKGDIKEYFETCHSAETSTDSLFTYLTNQNILDSTLIIFTSDNGFLFGEHKLTKKILSYEESMHVPLFIRYPKWFQAGTIVSSEIGANIDIAPTMLDAAGITDTFHMDGISLRGLANGTLHRQYLFFEQIPEINHNWEAVRSTSYKYIYSYCNYETDEFYDLINDPEENTNLINDTTYSGLISEFEKARDSLRLATTDTIISAIGNCSLNSFYYEDQDSDSYGNSDVKMNQRTEPSGFVLDRNDCNDSNAAIHRGAIEVCNGLDDNCNGITDEGFDMDGDGYSTCGGDCNDSNALVHPGAVEICNGVDDNCDGIIDEDSDADGDGYTTCEGDCNDADASIHPNAADICNGIDDNCDGLIDENAITATIFPSGTVTICKGSSQLLTANGGSGISYQWLLSNVNIPGATSQTYSATDKGDYTVSESNSFNCNSVSIKTTVKKTNNPAATITPLGNLDICQTGSVTLQANSGTGYTYQWKKGNSSVAGATAQTYTATKTGTYKVIVTNSSGCSKTSGGIKVTNSCREEIADALDSGLFVYPNPSTGNITIEYAGGTGNVQFIIYDMVGKIVFNKTEHVNNSYRFDLSNLTSGVYRLEARNKSQPDWQGNNISQTKFVIEK